MKALIAFAAALLLLGCSSSQNLQLSEVQPKRVFKVDRTEVFDAVRFYALREQFHIDSFEEETGRIIAHKVLQGRHGEDPKTVIMNLRVLAVEKGVTEVNAKFTYYKAEGVLRKDDEAELVDCFTMLFGTIAEREK